MQCISSFSCSTIRVCCRLVPNYFRTRGSVSWLSTHVPIILNIMSLPFSNVCSPFFSGGIQSTLSFNGIFINQISWSRSITFHLTASQLQFPTSIARFSGCRQRITRHGLLESGIFTAVTSIHDDNGDITIAEATFSCRSNRVILDMLGYLHLRTHPLSNFDMLSSPTITSGGMLCDGSWMTWALILGVPLKERVAWIPSQLFYTLWRQNAHSNILAKDLV